MMTMKQLLEDKTYHNYMMTKPFTTPHAADPSMTGQWAVYLQKIQGGPWKRKFFRKYKKALKFFFQVQEAGCYDSALGNRRIALKPPKKVVRIKGKYVVGNDGVKRQVTKAVTWQSREDFEGNHLWCTYCRRPTLFKYYSKHHALPQFDRVDSSQRRCCICGATERLVRGK